MWYPWCRMMSAPAVTLGVPGATRTRVSSIMLGEDPIPSFVYVTALECLTE